MKNKLSEKLNDGYSTEESMRSKKKIKKHHATLKLPVKLIPDGSTEQIKKGFLELQAASFTFTSYLVHYFPLSSLADCENDYKVFKFNDNFYVVSDKDIHIRTENEQLAREIKLCQHLDTGEFFIFKSRLNLSNSTLIPAVSEINISRKVGLCVDSFKDENQQSLYFIERYIPGNNLLDILKKDKEISVEKKIEIALLVLAALIELHQCRILHRDIKLENIVYAEATQELKFVDYELSLECDETLRAKAFDCNHTPDLCPPELLKEMDDSFGYPYSDKSDIYLLGLALSEWFGVATLLSSTNRAKNSLFKVNFSEDQQIAAILRKMIAQEPLERVPLQETIADLKDLYVKLKPSIDTPSFDRK